jgi:phage shock protein PspC (stress-responsive transcriptional regulator)
LIFFILLLPGGLPGLLPYLILWIIMPARDA